MTERRRSSGRTFVAGHGAATAALERALAPDVVVRAPEPSPGAWDGDGRDALDAFRAEIAATPPCREVVVCAWAASPTAASAVDVSLDAWDVQVEWALACWTSALVGAVSCCADGGSVVLVAELPAAIDVTDQLVATVVGEGLATFARSLSYGEGKRGVRVNVVATEVATAPERLLGSAPPLPSFPGRPEVEVAGAVELLLAEAACGITGTTVRADCGRAW